MIMIAYVCVAQGARCGGATDTSTRARCQPISASQGEIGGLLVRHCKVCVSYDMVEWVDRAKDFSLARSKNVAWNRSFRAVVYVGLLRYVMNIYVSCC